MDERAQRLTAGLTEVLNAIELHEERRDRRSFACPELSEPMTLDQVDQFDQQGEFMLADPIGYGLRKSIRKIGELLARDFPQHMHNAAEQAAGVPEGRSYGIRSDIVDKHWDGIKLAGGGVWIA